MKVKGDAKHNAVFVSFVIHTHLETDSWVECIFFFLQSCSTDSETSIAACHLLCESLFPPSMVYLYIPAMLMHHLALD